MLKNSIFEDEDRFKIKKYELPKYEPYEPRYDIKLAMKPMPEIRLPSIGLTPVNYLSSTGTICTYYK